MVYAEQIPNYYKPYAPIYFDKQIYSWTDKMRITIIAPSWNENKYGIDYIGKDPDHAIKISSRSHTLGPYRLAETQPNSGIFMGEVTLSGFFHDIDGDGEFDTTPKTTGTGPTDGFLQTQRNDAVTVSFEFADGVVLAKSAQVSWNTGNIEFSQPSYIRDEVVKIQVTDADMNLNPEAVDNIKIQVFSDSDSAGISVVATETDDESAVFVAIIQTTQTDKSSGNRLRAVPGDTITAKYKDRTLPPPYSISDEIELTAKAKIGATLHDKIEIEDVYFADSSANKVSSIQAGQQIQVVTRIKNTSHYKQPLTNIMQVSNEEGQVVYLSWMSAEVNAASDLEISQSWTPKQKGRYEIEFFLWRSLDNTLPLAQSKIQLVHVS